MLEREARKGRVGLEACRARLRFRVRVRDRVRDRFGARARARVRRAGCG